MGNFLSENQIGFYGFYTSQQSLVKLYSGIMSSSREVGIQIGHGWEQGLSQDLESGCPKSTIVGFRGCPILQGTSKYTLITIMNMYLLVEIWHYILIQCHGDFVEVEKNQLYMLEIDILRNYQQKILGVLRDDF